MKCSHCLYSAASAQERWPSVKRTRVVLTLLGAGGLLSLLAVVGLLGLGRAPQASTGSGHVVVCPQDGDVNQDGAVTPSDALLAFRYFLGLAVLDACQQGGNRGNRGQTGICLRFQQAKRSAPLLVPLGRGPRALAWPHPGQSPGGLLGARREKGV